MVIEKNIRVRSGDYCAWIARLPCAACLADGRVTYGVHVAHLRAGSLEHGKEHTGKATKPSDDPWTVGICPDHHTNGPKAQHNFPGGELAFWEALAINPFDLCLALSAAHKAGQTGAAVLAAFCGRAKKQRTAK